LKSGRELLYPQPFGSVSAGADKFYPVVTGKIKKKVPIFRGALGRTDIARKNWRHFAISGISLVCGDSVCGIGPVLDQGLV